MFWWEFQSFGDIRRSDVCPLSSIMEPEATQSVQIIQQQCPFPEIMTLLLNTNLVVSSFMEDLFYFCQTLTNQINTEKGATFTCGMIRFITFYNRPCHFSEGQI